MAWQWHIIWLFVLYCIIYNVLFNVDYNNRKYYGMSDKIESVDTLKLV